VSALSFQLAVTGFLFNCLHAVNARGGCENKDVDFARCFVDGLKCLWYRRVLLIMSIHFDLQQKTMGSLPFVIYIVKSHAIYLPVSFGYNSFLCIKYPKSILKDH
jgi:hypothetical protein